MSKTSVVSTDRVSSMTVLMPEELSVTVPEFTEIWIPLPPGQLMVCAEAGLTVAIDNAVARHPALANGARNG
jgi:hypothetical protein